MKINEVVTWLRSEQGQRSTQILIDGAKEALKYMPPSKLKQFLTQLSEWQTTTQQSISDKSMSSNGIASLKSLEGLRLNAYQDVGGVWTIGYGHTSAAGGMSVVSGQVITNQQAEQLLKDDLARMTYPVIERLVKVPLSQGQFDALASFIYNLGEAQVSKSTLLQLLNSGDYSGASNEFSRWVYVGSVKFDGLIRRRQNERELFDG